MHEFTDGLPDGLLWERVVGLALVGFHQRHIRGVVDRLFTTAARGAVKDEQRRDPELERRLTDERVTVHAEVAVIGDQVARSLDPLRSTDPETLDDARVVGARRPPAEEPSRRPLQVRRASTWTIASSRQQRLAR